MLEHLSNMNIPCRNISTYENEIPPVLRSLELVCVAISLTSSVVAFIR